MMNDVTAIYRMVLPFARAMPLVFALPIAAELIQHVAEVSIGFYVAGHAAAVANAPARMGPGVMKVLAILFTVIIATRWWAFGGDRRRALALGGRFWRGVGIILLVQIAVAMVQAAALRLLPLAVPALPKLAGTAIVMLLVLLLTAYIQPWMVALMVEDRTMTARHSIAGIRGHLLSSFGLLMVAALPLMIVHYALGYGAMGRPAAVVWAMLAVDAAVVGFLAVLIAAGSYVVYERAATRTGGRHPS